MVRRIKIISALVGALAAVLVGVLPVTAAQAKPAADPTNCVAAAIDLNGGEASPAPFAGTGTLDCTAPTDFTLRFLVNGQQVKQTTTSSGAGTVTVDATLSAAEAPGCLITPTPPAGSGDCVGLRSDLERFAVSDPNETRFLGDATIRCYDPTDLGGRLTVNGATVLSFSYPDSPPGDIPVFEGVPAAEVDDQPGDEVCWFARVYGYDAVGACDTYDD